MSDVTFPAGSSDIVVDRNSRVLADNGTAGGDAAIAAILDLIILGDLPPGSVQGDRFKWNATTNLWEIVRDITTGGLTASAALADTDAFRIFQGASDGSDVKTTLAALYTYLLGRFMSQNTVIEDISATAYTMQQTDRNKIKRFTAATAVTVNVPASLAVGTAVGWIQQGAGQITFQTLTGAGQVLQSASGLKSAAQFSRGSLLCVATNTWNLSGLTVI